MGTWYLQYLLVCGGERRTDVVEGVIGLVVVTAEVGI